MNRRLDIKTEHYSDLKVLHPTFNKPDITVTTYAGNVDRIIRYSHDDGYISIIHPVSGDKVIAPVYQHLGNNKDLYYPITIVTSDNADSIVIYFQRVDIQVGVTGKALQSLFSPGDILYNFISTHYQKDRPNNLNDYPEAIAIHYPGIGEEHYLSHKVMAIVPGIPPNNLKLSGDGNTLAWVTDQDQRSKLHVYDFTTQSIRYYEVDPVEKDPYIHQFALSFDGSQIALLYEHNREGEKFNIMVSYWRDTLIIKNVLSHGIQYLSLAISPSGEEILIGIRPPNNPPYTLHYHLSSLDLTQSDFGYSIYRYKGIAGYAFVNDYSILSATLSMDKAIKNLANLEVGWHDISNLDGTITNTTLAVLTSFALNNNNRQYSINELDDIHYQINPSRNKKRLMVQYQYVTIDYETYLPNKIVTGTEVCSFE